MSHTNEQFAVAEAAVIEDPDLAAYTNAGFEHANSAVLVVVYLAPDHERYVLEDDGTIATLYTGQRYDAATLQPLGSPKRSNDPETLRRWWKAQTGYPASSPALSTADDRQ